MTPRRPPRPRTALLVVGLLLLLIAVAAGTALAVRPVATAVPLDPGILNEQTLIARGLSGVPGPGQPTAPVTVDRVVTDGATTYVQFHSTTGPGRYPDINADLSDDIGVPITMNYSSGMNLSTPRPALPVPITVPSWFPWHPPFVTRGLLSTGPLRPTARAVVLHFSQPGSTTVETVRVPLNLAALRHVRAYSGPLVQRAGLRLRVAAARDTGLVLGFSPFGDVQGATLTDAQGHVAPLRAVAGGCGVNSFADVAPLVCRQVWTYPLQRRGTRLTLSIRSFAALRAGVVVQAVGAGPWRLPVVIP